MGRPMALKSIKIRKSGIEDLQLVLHILEIKKQATDSDNL
jgi:hypothetical protein